MLVTTALQPHGNTTWTIWLPLIASVLAIGILGIFNTVSLNSIQRKSILRSGLLLLLILCTLYAFIAGIERLIWISCKDYYPHLLSTTSTKTFSSKDLAVIEADGKAEISIKPLSNGDVAIRTGYWWPMSRVLLVKQTAYNKAAADLPAIVLVQS